MENFIIIAIILIIVGLATWYIIKAKKSGKKCIGCPESAGCGSKCGETVGCCCCSKTENKE